MEEAREVERGAVEEEEDEAAAAAARVAVEMVLVVISSEGDRSSPCKECEGGGAGQGGQDEGDTRVFLSSGTGGTGSGGRASESQRLISTPGHGILLGKHCLRLHLPGHQRT